eukprot:735373_1
MAAQEGHIEVVRVLLSHSDTDIDYQNLNGVTPLWAACQNNKTEVVELLLHPRNVVVGEQTDNKADWWDVTQKKGTNPNLAKHDGCTPLWIAASRGNSECMEPLINYG